MFLIITNYLIRTPNSDHFQWVMFSTDYVLLCFVYAAQTSLIKLFQRLTIFLHLPDSRLQNLKQVILYPEEYK